MAKDVNEVRVCLRPKAGDISVSSPFNPHFIREARTIDGRWLSHERVWVFPAHRWDRVVTIVTLHYPSTPTWIAPRTEAQTTRAGFLQERADLLEQVANCQARVAQIERMLAQMDADEPPAPEPPVQGAAVVPPDADDLFQLD